MKETRKFFDNNKLNKGYSNNNKKVSGNRNELQGKAGNNSNNYGNFLPPAEVMAAYEEIYPGATAKLFQIAEEEQKHRHIAEMIRLEQYQKSSKLGVVFGFIKLVLIVILVLALTGNISNIITVAVLILSLAASCIFCGFFKKNKLGKTFDKQMPNNYKSYKNDRYGHNKR